jgi:integrase
MAKLHNLSDVQLRAWLKAGNPLAKSDGGGLTFTLSAVGCATWVFRYRFGGKQKERTIGRYPDPYTLEKARAEARRLRDLLADGKDAALEKHRERQNESFTVSDLAEGYKTAKWPALAGGTVQREGFHLRDVLGYLGAYPVTSVTARDVAGMVGKVAKRSPYMAVSAFQVASKMFRYAVGNGLIANSPCAQLKVSELIGEIKVTERVALNDQLLARLLKALPDLGAQNELMLRALLATGVRKGELRLARWEYVDFEAATWTIPWQNIKTGKKTKRDFVVPLVPSVLNDFRALKLIASRSPWVLPARLRRETGNPVSEVTFNKATDELCKALPDLPHFSPHDLRRTMRSHLAALGCPIHIAERCLNHEVGAMIGVYDRHDYLSERQEWLGKWAAKLRVLEDGPTISAKAA